MTVWEFGLETRPFDAVVAGNKTIEGRLNKGKFVEFAVGDIVKIRKDYRDEHGVIYDGQPDTARVEIVAVRKYPSFSAMVEKEGYKHIGPLAHSPEEVIASYNKYYSTEDQAKYGVLAIEVKVISR